MLGFTIIKKNELQRLRDVDSTFSTKIGELKAENFRLEHTEIKGRDNMIADRDKEIFQLKEKLGKFDRKRVNGKFVKTTN